MRFIDEFVKKALEEKGSFNMERTEESKKDITYYHFMQDAVGNARYIYGCYSWNNPIFYANVERDDRRLVAIVSQEKVYIVDEFMVRANTYYLKGNPLPENAMLFEDYVKEVNTYANDVVLEEFLSTIDIPDNSEETGKEVKKVARELLFTGNTYQKKKVELFKSNDVVYLLCGYIALGLKEEIMRRLELEREYWSNEKSFITKVEKAMQKTNLVAENWEIEMAKGLREVPNAKSVTVEFKMDDIKATGKMEPSKLMRLLIGKEYGGKIDYYDFIVHSEGKRVFENLNADWYDNPLTCKHITKISYGKRLLFDERLVEVDA